MVVEGPIRVFGGTVNQTEERERDIDTFLRIPFAVPPMRSLYFRRPQTLSHKVAVDQALSLSDVECRMAGGPRRGDDRHLWGPGLGAPRGGSVAAPFLLNKIYSSSCRMLAVDVLPQLDLDTRYRRRLFAPERLVPAGTLGGQPRFLRNQDGDSLRPRRAVSAQRSWHRVRWKLPGGGRRCFSCHLKFSTGRLRYSKHRHGRCPRKRGAFRACR